MTVAEPLRSRIFVVTGLVLGAAGTTLLVASRDTHNPWLDGLSFGWFLLLPAIGFGALIAYIRRSRRPNPARFVLTRNGFGVPSRVAPGLIALLLTMLVSNNLATTISRWLEVDDPNRGDRPFAIVLAVLAVPMLVIVTAILIAAWRGISLELTQAGIIWRPTLFSRTVPWEALWAGGPPRPLPGAKKLELAIERPELVTTNGLTVFIGNKERLPLPLLFDLDAAFLADAIRWYVEHPEHRAAIGAAAEHDRLCAALQAVPTEAAS